MDELVANGFWLFVCTPFGMPMVRTASDEPPPLELDESSLLPLPEEQAVASRATVAIPAIIVASLRVLTECLLALLGYLRCSYADWTDWGALPNDCGPFVAAGLQVRVWPGGR